MYTMIYISSPQRENVYHWFTFQVQNIKNMYFSLILKLQVLLKTKIKKEVLGQIFSKIYLIDLFYFILFYF